MRSTVAIETPRPSPRVFGVFTLIGVYVGVVPVALGLLWFPLMKRMGTRGLQFLMALTIGLLAYLFVDASHDGLESAALVPGSLQGPALFVFGASAAYLALDLVGAWLGRRRAQAKAADERPSGWVLAILIAIGIGLHNFGEGLAIGSAFALGELTLGTLLIVGFALHNTTEGLAIVAPLARRGEPAVGVRELATLGLLGGVPTIVGAWLGALVSSPVLSVLFLALGVGGIAQVTRQILMHSAGERGLGAYFRESHVVAGLAAGVHRDVRDGTGGGVVMRRMTFSAIVLMLLAGWGCRTAAVREVTLVARGMTFALPEQPAASNPTVRLRAGERVRLVLKNEALGPGPRPRDPRMERDARRYRRRRNLVHHFHGARREPGRSSIAASHTPR